MKQTLLLDVCTNMQVPQIDVDFNYHNIWLFSTASMDSSSELAHHYDVA